MNEYENQLTEAMEEKSVLSTNQIHLDSVLKEKSAMSEELKDKLNQITATNLELQQSLQSNTSVAHSKFREYETTIGDLQEKIEEKNYSIDIYESQNGSLESERKAMHSFLHDTALFFCWYRR